MKFNRLLWTAVCLFSIPAAGQQSDSGPQAFLRRLGAVFRPAETPSSGGLPAFEPRSKAPRSSQPPVAANDGSVTLTAEQFAALYALASRAQSPPEPATYVVQQPAAAAPEFAPAPADGAVAGEPEAAAIPRLALPATPAATRVPRPAPDANPPLRRKQRQ